MDSPKARAVYPPSGASSTRKINSFMALVCRVRTKREKRYFRAAVEAHGDTHGADAAVRVEDHISDLVAATRIFAAILRQVQRADEWRAYLSAMRVPRKLQVEAADF